MNFDVLFYFVYWARSNGEIQFLQRRSDVLDNYGVLFLNLKWHRFVVKWNYSSEFVIKLYRDKRSCVSQGFVTFSISHTRFSCGLLFNYPYVMMFLVMYWSFCYVMDVCYRVFCVSYLLQTTVVLSIFSFQCVFSASLCFGPFLVVLIRSLLRVSVHLWPDRSL